MATSSKKLTTSQSKALLSQIASIQKGINSVAASRGVSLQKNSDGSYSTVKNSSSSNDSFQLDSSKKVSGITDTVASEYYQTPKTINSSSITPTSTVNFPTPPTPSNLGTQTMTNITGMAQGALNGVQTAQDIAATAQTDFEKYLKGFTQAPSAEDIYAKTERQVGLQQKQEAVNMYAGQLQAISAKAQADKLSLEGQGRGVTDVIIGGQQAQIDREAAIQSLPISALLSAAQGDLQAAQDHLDTLFRLRLEDAQNKVDYKNKVNEAVYGFATAKQKAALDRMSLQDERNFTMTRDNLNYQRDLALKAMANGQSSLAVSIGRLDPSSATFTRDIANLSGSFSTGSSSGSSMIKLGATEKQILLGSGLSAGQISAIEQDANDFGITAVLQDSGLTAAQKTAIQQVYGAKDTTQFLNQDYFSSIFTDEQLKTAASEAGFRSILSSWATEKQNYLDYLNGLVEKYRAAGYSDQEILKMMQK